MATEYRCGQKGGYDCYSKCHYHSTNHITAIRPILNVFEISSVNHEGKKSEKYGIVIMCVKSN